MTSSERENGQPDSQPLEVDETAMLGGEEPLQLDVARPVRMPGDAFGRYRIRKILGEGAMGSVYLAHDTQLIRKVALKIPKLDARQESKFIVRFLREARSAANLRHPNICPIYDVGEIDGTHFIAMAYIEGQPLSEFISPAKPQRDRNAAVVVRKIALALNEAHINGLIHRDVKPANVMIDQRNEPIIMDFGLARQLDAGGDARLTSEGAILGSPAYMSPEQIEGHEQAVGPTCDVYSLGVILYELITGQLPFQGSIASIIAQVVAKQPDDPRKLRPDIDPRLASICLKAIAKRAADRYGTMKAFANALTDFLKKPDERPVASLLRTESKSKKEGTDTKAGTDTDAVLEYPDGRLEVTCKCGQRLVAQRRLAGKRVKCPRCASINTMPGSPPAAPAATVDVACDACGQRFVARPELLGKVVKCTTCGRPLVVPKPGAQRPTDQIAASCRCGQQFLANRELAGRKVKCTSCGRPLTIPRA